MRTDVDSQKRFPFNVNKKKHVELQRALSLSLWICFLNDCGQH